MVSSSNHVESLTNAEMNRLHCLLSEMDNNASSSFARSDIASTNYSNFSLSSQPWIIDSGASDHTTGIPSLFSSYNLLCWVGIKFELLMDLYPVFWVKGILYQQHESLSSVLQVPNLSNNLLSLSH